MSHEDNAIPNYDPVYQLIDVADVSLFWKDREGKILGCNKYMLDIFGITDRNQVVGKSEYDYIPPEEAQKIRAIDQQVLDGKPYRGIERATIDGQDKVYLVSKTPLKDAEGNIIGVIGAALDITEREEKEKLAQQNVILRLEQKAQQFLAEQQAKFQDIVKKVVHDIRSPLTALSGMLDICNEVPENKRSVLRQSLNSAFKIVHSLANHYSNQKDSNIVEIESRQDLLVADYLTEIFNEKKYQYLNHAIDFEIEITESAKAAHIDAQITQLRRAISNLINNAIDALQENKSGIITIILDASEKWVNISIADNGVGMPADRIEKIQNHVRFTAGKVNGHGLGLQQVWDMLEYNRGKMAIESDIDQGTLIRLTFPRSSPAKWLIQEIVLYPDTILVILDDETLVLQAWKIRLEPILRRNHQLQAKYFSQGESLLDFLQTLTAAECAQVLLLADYDLRYQKQNGLQVIVDSQIKNAILVTAHSSNAEVRKAVLDMKIGLLPKQLLADVEVRIKHC